MSKLLVNLVVDLSPFSTPNFVLAAHGHGGMVEQGQSFPLSAISAESLAAMCDEWRATVFAEAKLKDPRKSP